MPVRTLKSKFNAWEQDWGFRKPTAAEAARADYESRRTMALRRAVDADLELRDGNGRVVASFQQRVSVDADDSAYRAALNPPPDDSMERYERSAQRKANANQPRRKQRGPRIKPSPQAQVRSRPSFGVTAISAPKRPDGTPWW